MSQIPFVFEFDNHTTTRLGIFPMLATYLQEVLQLAEHLKIVQINKDNQTFTVIDLLLVLLSLPLLGLERISHIGRLKTEQQAAASLGLKRWPGQAHLHGFLNCFNGWQVNQLGRVNRRLLEKFGHHHDVPPDELVVVDIDASTHSQEAQKRAKATPGRNKKAPGRNCYQWSIATCMGQIVVSLLRPGYEHCSQSLALVLSQTLKAIEQVDVVRLDGGYFSGATLKLIIDNHHLFIVIKARGDLKSCRGTIQKARPSAWTWVEPGRTRLLPLARRQVLDDEAHELWGVAVQQKKIVKKRRGPTGKKRTVRLVKWQTYIILTNLPQAQWSPTALWRFYTGRQTIELVIRETRQAFGSGKMPSQGFHPNAAWLWLVSIAFNVMLWFKRDVLPFACWSWSLNTLRANLIDVSANLAYAQGPWRFHFHPDFPYQDLLLTAGQNLAGLLEGRARGPTLSAEERIKLLKRWHPIWFAKPTHRGQISPFSLIFWLLVGENVHFLPHF
jgi:hypothetical protein